MRRCAEGEAELGDLPLNAELDPEGTGGELGERIWDDPKRDEDGNEKDADAEEGEKLKEDEIAGRDTDMMVRRRPMY